jgi:hypothetical protein
LSSSQSSAFFSCGVPSSVHHSSRQEDAQKVHGSSRGMARMTAQRCSQPLPARDVFTDTMEEHRWIYSMENPAFYNLFVTGLCFFTVYRIVSWTVAVHGHCREMIGPTSPAVQQLLSSLYNTRRTEAAGISEDK